MSSAEGGESEAPRKKPKMATGQWLSLEKGRAAVALSNLSDGNGALAPGVGRMGLLECGEGSGALDCEGGREERKRRRGTRQLLCTGAEARWRGEQMPNTLGEGGECPDGAPCGEANLKGGGSGTGKSTDATEVAAGRAAWDRGNEAEKRC
jgi:hypothetical protein